ncbi:hypothetical protein HBA55_21950 [Pseudomaricurvus alkylphenolicus]|uniref:LuxR C-terminal-related transcriptional regulator n=1 Tax=Pseudomaricurvus alkylphenolicus TaxID=1306991 RepID=UPI00142199B7|nr:LuxR C-terminal-related transcriptional regulator [Pseudomaricurvus alkylphenolicus]NIB42286.1 hypothetical protein [Pseudomaricurvus alkylphenolicus]
MKNPAAAYLIKTKFTPPAQVSGAVNRPRLIERLAQSQGRRLALVTAPAGFGKSTLLRQWYSVLMESRKACCWLSLDSGDNDPATFVRYFVASLQTLSPALGQPVLDFLDNVGPSDVSKVLGLLINEISEFDREIVFFLDDFHLVDDLDVCQFVELLLNLASPNFRMVIASRVRPDLSLGSMRVGDKLTELNAESLRFELAESREFLNRLHKLELSEEVLDELYQRSDGWVAGLQLASLYLKEEGRSVQRREFSGNFHDVADYLATDVFEKQPPELQRFLLGSSLLNRFNAELCNAVFEQSDSTLYIQRLKDLDLFLIPLDEKGDWYRYHHLFQEFLQGKLQQHYLQDARHYSRRASHWFDANGFFQESVDYALAGDASEDAAVFIEQHGYEQFVQGRMPQIDSLIKRIPASVCARHPDLLLLQATALYHMNQPDNARAICDEARECIDRKKTRDNLSDEQEANLETSMTILDAGIQMSQERTGEAMARVPADFCPPLAWQQGTINNILGYSHLMHGDFESAERLLKQARASHLKTRHSFGVAYSDCFMAMLRLQQGHLKQVLDIFRWFDDGISSRQQSIYVAPVFDAMRGVLHLEMNHLDRALPLLQATLPILEEVGQVRLLRLGYCSLARLYALRGDQAAALKLLDHALGLHPHSPSHDMHCLFVDAVRLEILLQASQSVQALKLATKHEIPLDDELEPLPVGWERVAYLKRFLQLRLLLVAGQTDTAIQGLEDFEQRLHQLDQGYLRLKALLVLALAHQQAGQTEVSQAILTDALRIAAPNDAYCLFLEEGEAMKQLLASAPKDRDPLANSFVETLLGYWGSGETADNKPHGLIEPLSGREIDVLTLMAQGRTNSDIADDLHISQKTVKWHATNIFGKLGVRNRTAAVITARELAIIDI